MYSQRAGPFNRFGPERVRQPAIRFDDLPPIAVVLLSHNHYDHCDLHTLAMLATKFDPLLITPLGNRRLVSSTGLQRIEELDWWQHSNLAPVPITLTPALHFSARTPFDRNRALWGGFVVEADGARIYFAGDTAYGPFFRDIGGRLGPLDLALIPIGAYEPRWFMQAVHMNPEEAVQAHVDLGGPAEHRHALRHVPADHRGHRRAAAGARRGPAGAWHFGLAVPHPSVRRGGAGGIEVAVRGFAGGAAGASGWL